MRTVGIIGGLGPLAGSHFYRRIIELSPAERDEEHISIILISDPTIPSRVKHLEGTGESPVPKLQSIATRLVGLGADILVIPSSTTNLYYGEICNAVDVPVISLIEEVASAIRASSSRRIGMLATRPTLTYGLYDKVFAESGIRALHPDEGSQREVTEIIEAVKGKGQTSGHFESGLPNSPFAQRIHEVATRSWAAEMDGLLLACTEIPLVFPVHRWDRDIRLFSTTDILARATVREAYR